MQVTQKDVGYASFMFSLSLSLALSLSLSLSRSLARSLALSLARSLARSLSLSLSRSLARSLSLSLSLSALLYCMSRACFFQSAVRSLCSSMRIGATTCLVQRTMVCPASMWISDEIHRQDFASQLRFRAQFGVCAHRRQLRGHHVSRLERRT